MATLTQNVLTILEQAKRKFNGETQKIAEILDELNEVIATAAAFEANDTHSHVVTVRSALPTISTRGPNEGASSTVSQVRQIREGIMVLDSIIQVDELIYGPESSFDEFMMQEVAAQLEATMQKFSEEFLYGDLADDPKGLNGMFTRYNSASLANVYDAGGAGSDCTDILMIEWGRQSAYLFYPKNSQAGITSKDLGEATLYDASSNPYRGYEYQVQLKSGIAVADDRAVQRLASIEASGTSNNLTADTVVDNMVYMKNALPRMGKNAVIYANRTTKSQMDIWALDKTNAYFTMETLQDGSMQNRFQGIPIRMIEQIIDTNDAL